MLPHQYRLYAILLLTVLDIVGLVASRYFGVEVVPEAGPLIETALGTALLILAPALADAVAVERRRRDPKLAGLSDDVREEEGES